MHDNSLYHYGIKGMHWGEKNGPPYPLSGGRYSASEKREIAKSKRENRNISDKKHVDKVIKNGTDLSTLSFNKDRTKDTDMFYAAYKKKDRDIYKAFFNDPVQQPVLDENGKEIGSGKFYKYQITNKAVKDLKIASEDSSVKAFANLYKNNRDFYNFITDPKRMQSLMSNRRYENKYYKEAKDALDRISDKNHTATTEDLSKVYRLFNYILPNDAKDVKVQRQKLFNELSKAGYSGLLDTNDAMYGNWIGGKAKAPVVVFKMEDIIPKDVKRLKMTNQLASTMRTLFV